MTAVVEELEELEKLDEPVSPVLAVKTPAVIDLSSIPSSLVELMSRIKMTPTFASERGLLYSFNTAKRNPYEPGNAIKDQEYEVLVKPESITLRNITKTTGINRKSGKVYSGWKVDRSTTYSFKAQKHGHRVLRIYEHVTRTKKYSGHFTNATARVINPSRLSYENPKSIDVSALPHEFDPANVKPTYTWSSVSISDIAHEFLGWAIFTLLKELDPTHPALTAKDFMAVAAYPVFHLFQHSVLNITAIRACMPKNYSLHSVPDARQFITKILGAESVRKDMVKAVVNSTDINAIFLAAQLKHLFPLDWLRDFVKSPDDHIIYENSCIYNQAQTESLVALLASLTLPQRKRLLVEKHAGRRVPRNMVVHDSIRMLNQLNPDQKEEYGNRIDYSSWVRLHDTLQEVSNEIRGKEESSSRYMKFEWHERSYMRKLHETSFDVGSETFTLLAPKTRSDLDNWGNTMHNCIGSYYHEVNLHRTNVFGVYTKDGILVANVEIAPNGRVIQYMEKYNSPASKAHFDALQEHIQTVNDNIRKEEAKRHRVQEAMKKHMTRD